MITFIRGKLVEVQPTVCVIEVGGVGLEVSIPISTFEKLPDINEQVELFIHFQVRFIHLQARDDALSLYGFATHEERELFRSLISVTKIGAKVALSVLSGMSIREFKTAISLGDSTRIAMIQGLGKKTAERLILALKEKISPIEDVVTNVAISDHQKKLETDAELALVSLGYKHKKAQQAIQRVIEQENIDALTIEKLVKLSLQVVG